MATTIKIKNSVTTTNAPSSLVQGEVAINITDKKVWVGNAATTPVQLLGDGGSASFTSIAFGAGTVSNPSITFTGDTNTGIYSPAADTIAFTEGGVEAMRITSAGNVGIGETSPSATYRTTIKGNYSSIIGGTLYDNGGGDQMIVGFASATSPSFVFSCQNAAGNMTFGTNNTERMRIDSSGNVLIGTTSAATSSTLNVVGAGYQPIYVNTTATGGGGVSFQRSGTLALYTGTAGSTWLTGSSTADGLIRAEANLLFAAGGGTERMRITSGGSLLLGTTTEQASITAVFSSSGAVLSLDRTSNIDGTLRDMVQFRRSVTSVGSITCSNTATAYNTSSDYRLKENIAPMVGALDKVSQLKPCTYKWKVDGSNGQGFIAHELQSVVPDAVTGEKDAVDKDGKPTYQGVDTSYLVATLTAAIQEQQAMIEELKQEVAKLKGV